MKAILFIKLKVVAVTNGGRSVTFDIIDIYGAGNRARFGENFKGTVVTLDHHKDPESNNIFPASTIEADLRDPQNLKYKFGNHDAGHEFVKDLLVAAMAEFDKEKELFGDTGGLHLLHWNLCHVFEAEKAKIDGVLTGKKESDLQNQQIANGLKHKTFKLFKSGDNVDPVSSEPIATESFYDLCRFFEFRGWPTGVAFATINEKRRWVMYDGIPPMLEKPGFTLPRPQWRNPELDRFYDQLVATTEPTQAPKPAVTAVPKIVTPPVKVVRQNKPKEPSKSRNSNGHRVSVAAPGSEEQGLRALFEKAEAAAS